MVEKLKFRPVPHPHCASHADGFGHHIAISGDVI